MTTAAMPGSAPTQAAPQGDDAGLALDLYKLIGQRRGDEIGALSTVVFRDLGALYQGGLDDRQTMALDRTLVSLQQITEIAAGLTRPTDTGVLRLADLLDEVCALCAPMAAERRIDLIPLAFDDLSPAYRGDPGVLRHLLVELCSTLIDESGPGPLVLRAMLADREGDPGADSGEALWISLESQGPAPNSTPPELPPMDPEQSGCGDLKPRLDRTSNAGIRLSLSLPPTTATADPQPVPPGNPTILFHHPLDIARSALGQRLRRLRFDARELDDLSAIGDREHWANAAALVLALPAGAASGDAPPALSSTPLPIILLSDDPSRLTEYTIRLPACIDDAGLFRALSGAIRRHRLAQPPVIHAPDAAAVLTGGDPELGERLLRMLIDELPTSLHTLQETIRQDHREGLKDAIHKLKGGAAYCGVPALHQVAVALDQAALSAPPTLIALLFERLQAEAQALTHSQTQNSPTPENSGNSDNPDRSQAPT